MKVGDDSDPTLWRSPAVYEPTLIRVVMRQQTVSGGIGIVIESYMTPDDIRERLDMISNAGKLQPRQKSLPLLWAEFSFGPVARIRKVCPNMRQVGKAFPDGLIHPLSEESALLSRPKVLHHQHRSPLK
jgi:hypothetical protein